MLSGFGTGQVTTLHMCGVRVPEEYNGDTRKYAPLARRCGGMMRKADLEMLRTALTHIERALDLLDQAGALPLIGARLDHARHELERELREGSADRSNAPRP